MREKIVVILIIVLNLYWSGIGQVAINKDGTPPDESAILDVKDSHLGFLPPRMSIGQRDAISAPAAGLLIFNTTYNKMEYYDGTEWIVLGVYSPILTHTCNTTFTYFEVLNPTTGEIWLDKNLSAYSVASSSDDHRSYGSLYQWGRLSDQHECIDWESSTNGIPQNGTVSTQSGSNVPGHSSFITNSTDWRNPKNDYLWQGNYGINNPCPTGFRIPTASEWETERTSWSSNNNSGAYHSPLRLPAVGYRSYDGSILNIGTRGFYWSSTISSNKSKHLRFFNNNAYIFDVARVNGLSIRCIKD